MTFGGEVDDGVRLDGGDQLSHGAGVGDVGFDEPVSRVVRDGGEVVEVARVGEFVEDHYAGGVASQHGPDEG